MYNNKEDDGAGQKQKKNDANAAPSLLGLFDPLPPSTNVTEFIEADINAPAGSDSHLMGLFAPPTSRTQSSEVSSSSILPDRTSSNGGGDRIPASLLASQKSPVFIKPIVTQSSSNNISSPESEVSPLLGGGGGGGGGGSLSLSSLPMTTTSVVSPNKQNPFHTPQSSIDMNSMIIGELDKTPKAGIGKYSYGGVGNHNSNNNTSTSHIRMTSKIHARMPSLAMPVISESRPQSTSDIMNDKSNNKNHHYQHDDNNNNNNNNQDVHQTQIVPIGFISQNIKNIIDSLKLPTTYIGSFVYVLYHVVFCLALASAIMRPNNPVSILGLMTKTAALGTLSASSVYWVRLAQEVPALYPTADLFLAPFLAKLALSVDQTLAEDINITKEENDAAFLASFGVLTAIGTCISSCLLLAASIFKLANLGSYLPFPVICGFFSAVGILTWTLAINVDTGGTSIGTILTSGDVDLIRHAMIHHIPTLIVAGFMKYLGPKNPFFVCLVVVVTVAFFYLFMLITGTTLDEMKEQGWFWSHEELVYEGYSSTIGFDEWAPPAPFGVLAAVRHVHWGAVREGLSTAIAMSFLYLIRCSVYVSVTMFMIRFNCYLLSSL
jgi:hypothetical protein